MKRLWTAAYLLLAGLAIAFAQQVSMPPPAGTFAVLCAYNATTQTIATGNVGFLQCDANGNQILGTSNTAISQQVASDPTVQAAAYPAGSCLGGWNSVSVTVNNGQSGLITTFRTASVGGSLNTITIYLTDVSPTGACVDRSAFTLVTGDIDNLLSAPVSVVLATPTGATASFGEFLFSPPKSFIAGGATNSGLKTIWYALVTSAVTPTGTTDVHNRIGVVLN